MSAGKGGEGGGRGHVVYAKPLSGLKELLNSRLVSSGKGKV